VIVSSLAGAFAFSCLQHALGEPPEWAIRVLITSFLALPWTLSVALLLERRPLSAIKKGVVQTVTLAALLAYGWALPGEFDVVTATRFFLLLIGLHLLVAFVPYVGKQEANGFWQYNKVLFLRILLAGLYSCVLYGGMVLALVAISNLFEVTIMGKWYATLAAGVFGVFNTSFFLAGVPQQWASLDERDDYPKGLLLFTQFVLLPLVTLYLLILYLYTGKILFMQTLPKGWVSYLVLGFSVAGILSLLLIHPIRQREGNRWIQTFARWFYLALVPLLGLLFVAIGERIITYGITENRYFVVVLAVWLLGLVLYFLRSHHKDIYWIPLSLSLLAFAASVGPWGAFQTAERSQRARLEALLQRNGLLQNGKISGAGKKLPFNENQQISSLLDYFAQRRATQALQPYFAVDLTQLDTLKRYTRSEQLHRLAQLTYVREYEREADSVEVSKDYYFSNPSNKFERLTSIAAYDYLITLSTDAQQPGANSNQENAGAGQRLAFRGDGDSLSVQLDAIRTRLHFYRGNTLLIALDLRPRLESLVRTYASNPSAVSAADMTLTAENERCKIDAQFSYLRFEGKPPRLTDVHYAADVLIALKRAGREN
jgi:hypothetical protein